MNIPGVIAKKSYDELIKSDAIVFAGIINEHGNLINCLKSSDSHTEHLNADDWASIAIQSMLTIRMQMDFDKKLGDLQFSFHRRKTYSIYVALMGDSAMFLISKNNFDADLANKLEDLTREETRQILN
ncbi:hypothetical protein C6988_07485 [Nitrosopumilus sp. b1]|uniref:hypothetical protein n=1 Tax=Nitrosopumilus sp. b1 TaxID=2109907 RepID=UPI0015F5D9B0|nr:hypothetical protein [Nitrosopumilus sp. b1]KAF6242515.1 hypothetical protein C6988_07485 [Nitrosopumilus sp. b1]